MGIRKILVNKNFLRMIFVVQFLVVFSIFANADGWDSGKSSHSVLYSDTITSKTDSSSVNVADELFVSGDIKTLGYIHILSGGELALRTIDDTSTVGFLHRVDDNVIGIRVNTGTNPGLFITREFGKEGNIGIGMTNPSEKLEVNGNIKASGTICDLNGCIGGVSGLWNQNGNNIFYNNGNVGIGTALPTGNLHIASANYPYVGLSNPEENIRGHFGLATQNDNFGVGTTPGDIAIGVQYGNDIHFGTSVAIENLALRMSILNNGNVGIGTTNPTTKLDVTTQGYPNDHWLGGWTNNLRVTSGNYPNIRFYASGSDKTSMIGNNDDGGLWFGVGSTESVWGRYGMVILPSGRIGIGNIDPAYDIHLSNDRNEQTTIEIQNMDTGGNAHSVLRLRSDNTRSGVLEFGDQDNGNSGQIQYLHSTNSMIFRTDATDKMTITQSGNVGIGTTNPQSKLEIVGGNLIVANSPSFDNAGPLNIIGYSPSTPTSLGMTNIQFADDLFVGDDIGAGDNVGAYSAFRQYNPSGTSYFMGSVGIGFTSPSNKLHVNGAIGATDWIGAGCETNCEVSNGYAILYPNGNIDYTGTLTQVSDLKLKKDIRKIDLALEKVFALEGLKYKRIDKNNESSKDDGYEYGFIAQEVEKVFPKLVKEMEKGTLKGVSYNGFIPILVEAVKELKEKNDELQKRILELESKINSVEN